MPSRRISATTAAICAASRCANSAWSIAMSVTRPALSRASVAPGPRDDAARATARRRARVGARASARRPGVLDAHAAAVANQRDRAVLGDDRVDRPVCARTARLQPIGRPVIAITGRPAVAQRRPARRAPSGDRAVGRQRVVDVGQDAAHAGEARGGRQRAQRRGAKAASCGGVLHKAPLATGTSRSLQSRPLSEERCKAPAVRGPRLGTLQLQPRSPARWSSWVSSDLLIRVRSCGFLSSTGARHERRSQTRTPPTPPSSPTCPSPPGAARKSASPRPRCPA